MNDLVSSSENTVRVLHVVHSMNCGGAENMIMNLYRHVDRTRIQFDFLVHSLDKGFFDDEIRELGGRIFFAPYYRVVNEMEYRRTFRELLIKHQEISIVHGHLGSCAHVYLDVARQQGRYTIAHSHNTKPHFTLKNVVYRFFTYRTRRIADFFMACSKEAGKYRFGEKITSDRTRYFVLNNAIDAQKFVPDSTERVRLRNELGVEEDEFLVGHIGRFDYQKNHSFLIDIFKVISESPIEAKLVLIGDGALREEIYEKVIHMGLQDKVIFTGIRSDVPQLLNGIDCFVFPSHFEGLPVTVVEAQAAGIPCVISDKITKEVGITPLVQYLPLEKSPEEWCENIILNVSTQRKDMSSAIKLAGYDIHTTVAWLANFYESKSKR